MKNVLKIAGLIGVAGIMAWSLPPKESDATYDRFKTVGVDTVSHGRTIIVIKDTKTGCLWGQVEVGNSGIDMFRITPETSCLQVDGSK